MFTPLCSRHPSVARFSLSLGAFAALSVPLSLAGTGCGGGSSSVTSPGITRVVTGETETIGGATVATWARLDASDKVLEAGVTLPLSVIRNPPAPSASRTVSAGSTRHTEGQTGPAGSFVDLEFPQAVQQSTFLNHFEMHWNPAGHPPDRYFVPHFDLHFYNQTLNEVAAVTAPDTVAPASSRIPTGYLYTGVEQTVPQMGGHAVAASEFAPGALPFSASMVLGYYRGRMTFVEPMITQATLLTKETITMSVPQPAVLGQATRYPTKFTAVYSPELDAYQCTFTDFANVTQ